MIGAGIGPERTPCVGGVSVSCGVEVLGAAHRRYLTVGGAMCARCRQQGDVKKEKVKVRKTELPVETVVPGMSPREVNGLTEKEGQMIANDKQEKDRQVRVAVRPPGSGQRRGRRSLRSGHRASVTLSAADRTGCLRYSVMFQLTPGR